MTITRNVNAEHFSKHSLIEQAMQLHRQNFFFRSIPDRNIDGRRDNSPVFHNNKTFSAITAA
jgi:hypothetical protein